MNERKHTPVSRKCQFLEMCWQLHPRQPNSTLWTFGAPRRTLLAHRRKVVQHQYRITADKILTNHIFTQSRAQIGSTMSLLRNENDYVYWYKISLVSWTSLKTTFCRLFSICSYRVTFITVNMYILSCIIFIFHCLFVKPLYVLCNWHYSESTITTSLDKWIICLTVQSFVSKDMRLCLSKYTLILPLVNGL